jgi:hypothetical protein
LTVAPQGPSYITLEAVEIPSMIIIGEVVRLRDKIAWFQEWESVEQDPLVAVESV